jgi:outer membrane protein OmpA-like peptidoglycan-associated protein
MSLIQEFRMGRAAVSLSRSRIAGLFAAATAAFTLSGCIGNSVYDDLNAMQPVGSPFNESLFKNYSFLAKSFGTAGSPSGQAFDADSAISITGAENTVSGLANAYAQKALAAGRGDEVLPEPAPESDADAENVRLELLRDLDDGREKDPDNAARAQADYDCWVMNRRVPGLEAAAQACRRSVTNSLAKLEHGNAPPPPPTAGTEPSAPSAPPAPPAPTTSASLAPLPQTAAAAAQFTVSFGYRSAQIAPDEMANIAQVIAAARSGRQSHITVVGHTDAAEDSHELSVRRADAVERALVAQGARSDAIAASGVGKDDPAVPTADHVKEAKNRRVVITLVP